MVGSPFPLSSPRLPRRAYPQTRPPTADDANRLRSRPVRTCVPNRRRTRTIPHQQVTQRRPPAALLHRPSKRATSPPKSAEGPHLGNHHYYDARAGWGNKNGRQLRRYGMKVDIRCMGMVAIWDLSAVAEIVAQRAMALKPGRSLPKTVLGLTERPKPPEWGGRPPPERETPPPPRRPVMGASGAYQWQCPAPQDELLQTAAGGRNTALFDALRKSAYRLPRGSGNDDVRRRWGALWVDFAIQANRMFPEPLGEREVSKTAASVSRWTWTNPEFGRGGDDGRRDPAEQSTSGVW